MDPSPLVRARDRVRAAVDRRACRDATEPLDLDQLVSPLRYDIMVRAEYFDFLVERLDLYDGDFDRYVVEATTTRYFTWFSKVALTRFHPRHAADPADVLAAFRERLHRSTRLLRSFAAEGFDTRYPISVRTAVPRARTGTGKLVERSYYPGDGCHRLALLVRAGQRTLPPSHYRIRRTPVRVVIDNTHALISEMRLAPEEYYRFLSRGYADQIFSEASSLLGYVAAYAPNRLDELSQVIRIDELAFVPTDRESAARLLE